MKARKAKEKIPGTASKESTATTKASKLRDEIIRLHDFFAAWFSGSCPDNDRAFAAGVESALAPSFSMVVPSGETLQRADLLNRLRTAHGIHSEHGLQIEIRNVALLWDDDDDAPAGDGDSKIRAVATGSNCNACLVRYEEWQRSGSKSASCETARTSTALILMPKDQNNINDDDDPSPPTENSSDDHPPCPSPLRWIHVHETWMSGKGPPASST